MRPFLSFMGNVILRSFLTLGPMGLCSAVAAPTDIVLDNHTIMEGAPEDTLVGLLSAVDDDEAATHTFSMAAGAGSTYNFGFRISGNQLISIYGVSHDFESGPLPLPIRLRVTSSSGESFEKPFVLEVSDNREEDADGDGLLQAEEEDIHGTSDLLFDTDGDGAGDGAEVAALASPTDPANFPAKALLGWGSNTNRVFPGFSGDGFLSLATGQNHSLGLKSNGDVVAWGGNDTFGQLTVPEGLGAVAAISAGGDFWFEDTAHSLALKQDGTLEGWGYDLDGKIVIPEGLQGVVSISSGRTHCLALKDDGTVTAWGENPHGELQPPEGLSNVVAISAGGFHNLAVRSNGTVVGWGSRFDGIEWVDMVVPGGLSDVVAVAAGRFHSLALRSDGTVVGWGYNEHGQASVPAGLSDVVAIAAGGFHSLALKADGSVVAWGLNSNGQTLVPTAAASHVRSVSAGLLHSQALRYESGFPEITSSRQILGLPGDPVSHQVTVANAVATGFEALGLPEGLAIDAQTGLISGTAVAPARNTVWIRVQTDQGLLSQTAWVGIAEGSAPTSITIDPAEVLENSGAGTIVGTLTALDPDVGDLEHSFELVDVGGSLDNGLFRIEGTQLLVDAGIARDFEMDPSGFQIRVRARDASLNPYEQVLSLSFVNDDTEDVDGDGLTEGEELLLGTSDLLYDSDGDGFGDAFEVHVGSSPVDHLDLPEGRLWVGWGDDSAGQAYGPPVVDWPGIVGLSAGTAHGLAVKSDGSVLAWGDNQDTQCDVPTDLGPVAQVAAGGRHSLALLKDGTVRAWGADDLGQVSVPQGLDGVVEIAAGSWHNLALKGDGTVVAWGYNDQGQATVPLDLGGVVRIAAGDYHSLALKHDGSVVAWGSAVGGASTVPADLMGVVAIVAGGGHNLALRYDGTVVAWGSDLQGQTAVPTGLEGVVEIAAGALHSVAIKADGSLVTWGDDSLGQTSAPMEAAELRVITAGAYFTAGLRQSSGFPGFSDASVVRSWPGESVSRPVPLVNALPDGIEPFSAMGLPAGLSIDPATGVISGTVVEGVVRMVRVMAETDQGWMSQILLFDTSEGHPPTDILLSPAEVTENSPDATVIGLLTVIDPNIGDSHVLEIVNHAAAPDGFRFLISNDSLVLNGALTVDHDVGETSLTVRIAATDLGDNRIERDLVINVLDDRTEDADADGVVEFVEEDVLGTSDLEADDLRTADGDGDGIPGIIEHAFNLDPRTAGPPIELEAGGDSIAGLPVIGLVDDGFGGQRLRLEFIQRVGSGLIYAPQFSSGMGQFDWQDASANMVITPVNQGWERCVVEDTESLSGTNKRFGRVAVDYSGWPPAPSGGE